MEIEEKMPQVSVRCRKFKIVDVEMCSIFSFFARIGRTILPKKTRKGRPFECDELEKHCRVSAKFQQRCCRKNNLDSIFLLCVCFPPSSHRLSAATLLILTERPEKCSSTGDEGHRDRHRVGPGAQREPEPGREGQRRVEEPGRGVVQQEDVGDVRLGCTGWLCW